MHVTSSTVKDMRTGAIIGIFTGIGIACLEHGLEWRRQKNKMHVTSSTAKAMRKVAIIALSTTIGIACSEHGSTASLAQSTRTGVIIGIFTSIGIACSEHGFEWRRKKNKMEDLAVVNDDKSVVSVLVSGVEGLSGQVEGQTPAVEKPTGQVGGLINTRSPQQDDTSVSDIYPTQI